MCRECEREHERERSSDLRLHLCSKDGTPLLPPPPRFTDSELSTVSVGNKTRVTQGFFHIYRDGSRDCGNPLCGSFSFLLTFVLSQFQQITPPTSLTQCCRISPSRRLALHHPQVSTLFIPSVMAFVATTKIRLTGYTFSLFLHLQRTLSHHMFSLLCLSLIGWHL